MRPLRTRRAVVLLAALVTITIGALVGSTVMYLADAEAHAADAALRRVQARALAWSGVQAVMAELAAQRDDLVQGQSPKVTDEWTGFAGESETADRLMYQVVSVQGAPAVSEMGKLDINAATSAMIAKLPGVGEALAKRIVGTRDARRLASVAELLDVEGVTPHLLYGDGMAPADGPIEAAPEPSAAADTKGSSSPSPSVSGASAGANPTRLADLVTVFSFDPDVQVGLGNKGSDATGNQRINLNTKWSERLGDAIERRFDKTVADAVKQVMDRGTEFKVPSDVVKVLRGFKVEPTEWAEVLDAFTTSEDEFLVGRVDLMRAEAAVLACVPGIDADGAAQIVQRRDKIDDDRRRTVVWPVLEGILTPDQFEQAVDWLTIRSMQWRVIVEGGILPGGSGHERADREPPGSSGSGLDASAGASDPVAGGSWASILRDRVVLEAVIDVSSKRPRVAYLRDVTMLPLGASLAASKRAKDDLSPRPPAPKADEAAETAKPSPAMPPVKDAFPDDHWMEIPDLQLGPPAPPPEPVEAPKDPFAPSAAPPANVGTPAPDKPDAPGPNAAKHDPRLGRWTAGPGGKP